MSTRRRFQAPSSRGSYQRARRAQPVPSGEAEAPRDEAAKEESPVTNEAPSDGHVWLVDDGEGKLRLVRGVDALKALIAERGLAKTTSVYALSPSARTLGELAEVRADLGEDEVEPGPTNSDLEPEAVRAEPSVGVVEPAPADLSSQAVDDELALLDRPFDDGEYFEDPPRARWLRPAGVAAVVLVLGAGGYQLFQSRSAARAPIAVRQPEAPKVALAEPPPAATPPVAPAAVVPPPAPTAPTAPEPPPAAVAVEPPAPVAAPRESSRYPELVAEGERQFQNGQTRRAQTLFEQALAETPEGTAALVGLAYVHLDRGKLSQATALFQRALVQDRADPTALFGLAESHRQAGDRSAALAEFQRFLTLRSSGNDAELARQLVQELTTGG